MRRYRYALRRRILASVNETGCVQLDPIDTDDPEATLLDVVASCFEPVTHFDNPMVMDLRPRPGMDPTSYAGTARLALHTDRAYMPQPPRYIAMMCIDPGIGGEPEISDGAAAAAMLDAASKRQLREREFPFRLAADNARVGYTGPILTPAGGRDAIRFRRDLLPVNAGAAVAALGRALRKTARRLDVRSGSIWIVDNHRVLHGRAALHGGIASRRHLKRVYAEDR